MFGQTIVAELQEIITQAISRDEAALAIAQKVSLCYDRVLLLTFLL